MMGNVFITIGLICLPFALIDSVIQRKAYAGRGERLLGGVCFVIICGVILFYSYFRDPLTGTDSLNNYTAFRAIALDSSYINYEIGYMTLVRLFHTYSGSFQEFIRFCTWIILLPVFYVLRNCPYRSFLLTLFALGELNATFDVLKGFISFAFVLTGFYIWNMKGKKVGLVITAMSLLFHLSSVFFIIVFLAARVVKTRKSYFIVSIIAILGVVTPLFRTVLRLSISAAAAISPRFIGYAEAFGSDSDFSLTYVLIYLIPNVLALHYFPSFQFISGKRNNSTFRTEDKSIKTLVSINWILFMLSIVSTWMPVMHRYLKLSLIFTHILIGYCLNKEPVLKIRFIIILVLFMVNVMFAYLNNGGFVYKILL